MIDSILQQTRAAVATLPQNLPGKKPTTVGATQHSQKKSNGSLVACTKNKYVPNVSPLKDGFYLIQSPSAFTSRIPNQYGDIIRTPKQHDVMKTPTQLRTPKYHGTNKLSKDNIYDEIIELERKPLESILEKQPKKHRK